MKSYHWISEHVTIHPFIVYYKGEQKVEHFSFVAISHYLEHNTVSVYTFQKKLIEFLKTKFETVLKNIFLFSVGPLLNIKIKI